MKNLKIALGRGLWNIIDDALAALMAWMIWDKKMK